MKERSSFRERAKFSQRILQSPIRNEHPVLSLQATISDILQCDWPGRVTGRVSYWLST